MFFPQQTLKIKSLDASNIPAMSLSLPCKSLLRVWSVTSTKSAVSFIHPLPFSPFVFLFQEQYDLLQQIKKKSYKTYLPLNHLIISVVNDFTMFACCGVSMIYTPQQVNRHCSSPNTTIAHVVPYATRDILQTFLFIIKNFFSCPLRLPTTFRCLCCGKKETSRGTWRSRYDDRHSVKIRVLQQI